MTAQDYLKAIRDKGLTQVQIAERTHVAQGTISKIERGEVSSDRLRVETYLAIKALHSELCANDESAKAD